MRNFYEKLVLEALEKRAENQPIDEDLMQDMACLALNRLPPKYYRYEVDLTFFMNEETRIEMEKRVENALEKALDHINTEMQSTA